jgi:predicted  nucleic acid-binding Zn-ribbon protein
MKSIGECAIIYPDISKVPLSVCQECPLRKLPYYDDNQCAYGTDNLKENGYDS